MVRISICTVYTYSCMCNFSENAKAIEQLPPWVSLLEVSISTRATTQTIAEFPPKSKPIKYLRMNVKGQYASQEEWVKVQ